MPKHFYESLGFVNTLPTQNITPSTIKTYSKILPVLEKM